MASENSEDVRLENTEGQDDHKVTALPTHSSLDRTPQALMLTPLSHHLEG